jgi:hypothetical protein
VGGSFGMVPSVSRSRQPSRTHHHPSKVPRERRSAQDEHCRPRWAVVFFKRWLSLSQPATFPNAPSPFQVPRERRSAPFEHCRPRWVVVLKCVFVPLTAGNLPERTITLPRFLARDAALHLTTTAHGGWQFLSGSLLLPSRQPSRTQAIALQGTKHIHTAEMTRRTWCWVHWRNRRRSGG